MSTFLADAPTGGFVAQVAARARGKDPGACHHCGHSKREHKSRHNADPSRRAVCP